MTGTKAPNTIRVAGTVKGQELTILIDTGSSHSFIDPKIVERMSLPVVKTVPLLVQVANGQRFINEKRFQG
jgi:predicted aspartyl protease